MKQIYSMKTKYILLFSFLYFISCKEEAKMADKNQHVDQINTDPKTNIVSENNMDEVTRIEIIQETNSKTIVDKIKLHKLKKLFVVGDFDGDGKQDTIFQHNYSRLTKTEIEYSADPFHMEWESVVEWFYDQDADLYLTINKSNHDTLHLGTAHGLYCLINIGDNNEDSKDEIALVIDYLDFSSMNSCKIYSLCNDKWTLFKQFGIHEDSFEIIGDKAPIFNNIKDFLEKQNNKWVYKEYLQVDYESQENIGEMMTLKLERCK